VKRVIPAGLALLSILAAAWWFGRGGRVAPPGPIATAPAARPVDPPVAAPPAPAAIAEPAPAPPAPEPGLRRWLEGTVRFEDGMPATGAELRAFAFHEGRLVLSGAEGVAAADGAFRLDVTPADIRLLFVLRDLQLVVEHRDARPATHSVPSDARALDLDRPVVTIPCDLVLPRAVIVTGRVVDVRGAPLRDALVCALPVSDVPFQGIGFDLNEAIDLTEAGESGEFRLRLDAGKPCLFGADLTGKRAVFRRWDGAAGSMPDLVLEDAFAISGRVLDAAGLPVLKARVRAELTEAEADADSQATTTGGRLRTLVGRMIALETVDGEAETSADGSFVLIDLDPGPHRVWVEGVGEVELLADAVDDAARDVRVPTGAVDLRLDAVRARIEVRVDGAPAPEGAALGIESRHRRLVQQSLDLGPGGVLEVLARPGASYDADLDAPPHSFEPRRFSIPEAGRTATVHLDFRRPAAKASLLVLASAPGGVPVLAGFGLFDPDDPQRFSPAVRRDVESPEGRFLLTDLPAGRWILVVRAGGAWNGGEGYFLDETLELEVPDEGQAEARVTLRSGGRIRIDARGPAKEPVPARCVVEDGNGVPVPVSFMFGSEGAFIATNGGLAPGGENLVVPALPEGTYSLRFTAEGYAPTNEIVRVRAGETTRVTVALEKSR
jgi:hypothetical protein